MASIAFALVISAAISRPSQTWRSCDVTDPEFGAIGDGISKDTSSIRAALKVCDEVWLPTGHTFLSGPINLTSNQIFGVDGTLLASTDRVDYPIVAPIMGYGWGDDENCFDPSLDEHKIIIGSLRYSPIIGAFHASNVTIKGSGTIDGQGQIWWENCTKCHYPPGNNKSFCLVASRPKLIEAQFVNGFRIFGQSPRQAKLSRPNLETIPEPILQSQNFDWSRTLKLQNSPFWTVTPSYTQNIHIHDLHIFAPMDRIGNTDGVNLDSCRNALIENIWINNSDDGISMKSGLNGFGLNLAIPTENVMVRNITCVKGSRGGFAIGSEMSGGLRNITFRDSVLRGERGIHLKPSVGRGGYIRDLLFENIITSPTTYLVVGNDGHTLMPHNNYVPLVSNLRFVNITGKCNFGGCSKTNQSRCFNLTVSNSHDCVHSDKPVSLPPQSYTCKREAITMFNTVQLPWPVCIPLDAPVNLDPTYPNWGPTDGHYFSIEECRAVCK